MHLEQCEPDFFLLQTLNKKTGCTESQENRIKAAWRKLKNLVVYPEQQIAYSELIQGPYSLGCGEHRDIARRFREKVAVGANPDPKWFAHYLGLKLRKSVTISEPAALIGNTIFYQVFTDIERRGFVIAHEVAHLLIEREFGCSLEHADVQLVTLFLLAFDATKSRHCPLWVHKASKIVGANK